MNDDLAPARGFIASFFLGVLLWAAIGVAGLMFAGWCDWGHAVHP